VLAATACRTFCYGELQQCSRSCSTASIAMAASRAGVTHCCVALDCKQTREAAVTASAASRRLPTCHRRCSSSRCMRASRGEAPRHLAGSPGWTCISKQRQAADAVAGCLVYDKASGCCLSAWPAHAAAGAGQQGSWLSSLVSFLGRSLPLSSCMVCGQWVVVVVGVPQLGKDTCSVNFRWLHYRHCLHGRSRIDLATGSCVMRGDSGCSC
jgi:hypothetical protein